MFKCGGNSCSCWPIISMKLAIASFVIIVLKIWPAAMTWVHNTNIWWFVVALIVFAIFGMKHCAESCGCKPMAKKPMGKKQMPKRPAAKKK